MNNGGEAFPTHFETPEDKYGMSLRDWFAGMAMSGIVSYQGMSTVERLSDNAKWAYAQADAMIVEREKK